MRRICYFLFFLILLFIGVNLASAEPPSNVNNAFVGLQPTSMFSGLPELAAKARVFFTIIAFAIMISVTWSAWKDAPDVGEALYKLATVFVLILVIAEIPWWTTQLDKMQLAVSEEIGKIDATGSNSYEGDSFAVKMTKRAFDYGFFYTLVVDELNRQDVEDGSEDSWGWFNWLKKIKDAVTDLWALVSAGLTYLVIIVICGLIGIGAIACGYIMELFESVRFFLFQLGTIMLPMFLAMTATKNFRSQGFNYLLGFIALILWPLGWALGHLGSIALVEQAVKATVDGIMITGEISGAKVSTAILTGDRAVIILAGKLVGTALKKVVIWPALLNACAWTIAMLVWMFLVTISIPVLVHKTLVSGASLFTPLAAGTGQATAALAGQAVTGMAAGGAQASLEGLRGTMNGIGQLSPKAEGTGQMTPGSSSVVGNQMSQGNNMNFSQNSGSSLTSNIGTGQPQGSVGTTLTRSHGGLNIDSGENSESGGGSSSGGSDNTIEPASPLGKALASIGRSPKSLSVGQKAGFIVGKGLVAASRWSGDPSGAVGMFDLPMDENVRHREQQNVLMANNLTPAMKAYMSAKKLSS